MEDGYQIFYGFRCRPLLTVTKHGENMFVRNNDASLPDYKVLRLQR
jgi:hypothetical protein